MGSDRHISMLKNGGESTALAVLPAHFSSLLGAQTDSPGAHFISFFWYFGRQSGLDAPKVGHSASPAVPL